MLEINKNASYHFSFGKAYPNNITGGQKMSDKELAQHGVNNSLIHVDFIIASPDLDIIGKTTTGGRIQIFENGNWAYDFMK